MKVTTAALVAFTLVTATSISLVASLSPQQNYNDLSGDFSCAAANQAKQVKAFPNWSYTSLSPDSSKQPIYKAWEPILEPVPSCNALPTGWTKQFSFLVVLDASWVRYYNENSQHFAAQGYHSMLDSANLMMDRVSYLFEKQFGSAVRARIVVPLANLGEACATNNNYADDGSDRTSTLKQLMKAGAGQLSTDAGIIRLGVGSYTPNLYCHSYSPVPGLCRHNSIAVNQQKPFADNGSGEIRYRAMQVLAHEVAHFFGVCPANNAHCLNSHSINELADIQVWDGTPAVNARPQGMFRKFMTTCSPLYRDTVCKEVKLAPITCGVHVPPLSISGKYFALKYKSNPNNWHYVTITAGTSASNFTWTNRAGVSWGLTRDSTDPWLFNVSPSCPYYSSGYKTARIATETTNGVTTVTGIYGPLGELYSLQSL